MQQASNTPTKTAHALGPAEQLAVIAGLHMLKRVIADGTMPAVMKIMLGERINEAFVGKLIDEIAENGAAIPNREPAGSGTQVLWIALHHHDKGVTPYTVWQNKPPTVDDVVAFREIRFDPGKGESIEIVGPEVYPNGLGSLATMPRLAA